MYIIRKTLPNGQIGFKTYDDWVQVQEREALDLSDVIRFTKGEAKPSNLRTNEEFVWFGCYKELKHESRDTH